MAKRFYFEQFGTAVENPCYTVEIHDMLYTGEAIQVNGGFKLKYSGGEQGDLLSPILTSTAEISIYISENDTEFESFLTSVVTFTEHQVVVKIFRDSEQIWKGQLLTDLIEIPDDFYTYEVQLTAVCGLARLKNITYENFGGEVYEGRATILQHVINCLAKIYYQSTWVHDLPILKVAFLTWEEQRLSKTESGLENIDLAYECFQEYDEFGVISSKDALDVLSEICRTFHYKIFMYGDCFMMQHVNDLNASFVYTYAADYQLLATEHKDYRLYFENERADGRFRYYPPQKSSSLIYNYKQGLSGSNLLPPGYTAGNYIEIFNVLGGNNEVLKLKFNIKVVLNNFSSQSPGGVDLLTHMKFKLKLKVGNFYLSGITSPEGNSLAWTNTESFFYYVPEVYFVSGSTTIIFNVSTNLPPAPEPGNGNFGIWFDTLCYSDGAPYTTYSGSATVSIYNISLVHLLESGTEISGKIKYSAVNKIDGSAITSGVVEELPDTVIGDGPRAYSAGRLRVYNTFNEVWTVSANWRESSGGAAWVSINKLRLQEAMAMKKRIVKAFEFVYFGFMEIWRYPQFKNERLSILSYEFDPDTEEISLDTFYYITERTGITLNEALDAPEVTEPGSSSSGNSGSGETALWKRFGETLSPVNEDDSIDVNGIYKKGANEVFTDPITSRSAGNINDVLIGQGEEVSPAWQSKKAFLNHRVDAIFRQLSEKTVSNTTTETTIFGTFSGSKTIPGNYLATGDYIRISIAGTLSTSEVAQQITIRIKFGNTTLISASGYLPASLDAAGFELTMLIGVITAGQSGYLRPIGYILVEQRSAGYPTMLKLQSSNDIASNTTSENEIDVTAQWQSAQSTNILKSRVSVVEIM